MRFSDNTAAAVGEYLNLILPGTNTASAVDRKIALKTLLSLAGGMPLRELALTDLFGTTDPQKAIQYASQQPEAVCVGDYVDLAAFTFTDDVTESSVSVTTTGNNSRIRVASNPTSYYRSGDSETAKGILYEFANSPFTRAMNASGSNTGDYAGSDLKTVLNGGFATALQSAVGSSNTIMTTRRLLSNNIRWGWESEKVFLLTESEVLGQKNVGATEYQIGSMMPLPIYMLAPHKRIKLYNNSRCWWWLASKYTISTDASDFAYVNDLGNADWDPASYVYGVSPAFGISNQ